MNQLILGDNLEIMRKMDSETIDLIYLDPPFFSNRNYEVIWGDKGEIRSFEDRWSGGIDHYIAWLKERVAEMHRLLKPTGSIYLHCDWHADAYIRVLILDKIFGENNFKNKLIWPRTNAHNMKAKYFGRTHDVIYFYTKDEKSKYTWNNLYENYSEAQFSRFKKDENGRLFKAENLTMTSRSKDRNFEWRGTKPPENRVWAASLEKLEEWYKEGKILLKKDGSPRMDGLKVYLDELPGKLLNDIWVDIERIGNTSGERIGYPTQKPEKLLERIILASSNEGDTVFDPFVGGGTTVVVADKLKRNWLGIDQSVQAIKVSEMRLNNQQNLFSAPFSVTLHKYDYDTLRYKDAFEFEKWIVEQFGGLSNIRQRNDFGMDGKTREGVPIQVKRSDNIGRNVIDNFHSAVMRFDKALYEKNNSAGLPAGFIISFGFGKGAKQEVARLQNEENVLIKLVTVDEIVPIAKKPKLSVKINDLGVDTKGLREIEFTAIGESEAGIEFYSWDFEYGKPSEGFQPSEGSLPMEGSFHASIMLDKEGKQTHKFKPGTHSIAVKAIAHEGLEAIEVVRVKVNGEVEIN